MLALRTQALKYLQVSVYLRHLGFIAAAQGVEVSEVAKGGIGLAFFAFPTIINKAPFGEVLGVLFFGSLTFAALTSFISVIEVIISAFKINCVYVEQKRPLLLVYQ